MLQCSMDFYSQGEAAMAFFVAAAAGGSHQALIALELFKDKLQDKPLSALDAVGDTARTVVAESILAMSAKLGAGNYDGQVRPDHTLHLSSSWAPIYGGRGRLKATLFGDKILLEFPGEGDEALGEAVTSLQWRADEIGKAGITPRRCSEWIGSTI